MGWEDRPYYRDHGAASNPLASLLFGSIPLFTVSGIRVRAHAWLALLVLIVLAFTWNVPFVDRAVSMAALLIVLPLHELGHCMVARRLGGEINELVLWPLGGMSFPHTPRRPAAVFLTAIAGPITNVLICAIAGGLVWLSTPALLQRATDPHTHHVLVTFNPFRLMPPATLTAKAPAFYCWWVFVISYVMLLLNLIPAVSLDGWHMVQAILWHVVGLATSMTAATSIGMIASLGTMATGLIHLNPLLISLAIWTFYQAYHMRMMMRETPGEDWGPETGDFASSLYGGSETKPMRRRLSKRAIRAARRRHREEEAERQRVDAILAKVSAQGLASLTWRERRVLRKATAHQRQRDLELERLSKE